MLIGRNCSTVSRWEAGTISPKPAERLRLAEILGVSVDSLFSKHEPAVIVAARRVTAARDVTDLRRAVAHLTDELAALDASEGMPS